MLGFGGAEVTLGFGVDFDPDRPVLVVAILC